MPSDGLYLPWLVDVVVVLSIPVCETMTSMILNVGMVMGLKSK
jgi:hypothetical protein